MLYNVLYNNKLGRVLTGRQQQRLYNSTTSVASPAHYNITSYYFTIAVFCLQYRYFPVLRVLRYESIYKRRVTRAPKGAA